MLVNKQEELEQRSDKETAQLQTLVKDFTVQSCEMLSTIEKLETENAGLRAQLQTADGGNAAQLDELKQKLAGVQQELLNLQTQHIELEERYLELKTHTS